MTGPNRLKRTNRRLWGEITFDDWCTGLDRMLSNAETEAVPGGKIWMVKGGRENSVAGLIDQLAEKAGYEDPWGEVDYIEAMDFVREHFMQDDHSAVFCEITSHMVSGAWGLSQFISGDRGYFYRLADWGIGDDEGEAIPILSAWAPASDAQVYEAAFLKTYLKHWGFGLPPFLGEWAEGPPGLMTNAMAAVLVQRPDMWKTVLDTLKKPERVLPHERLTAAIAQQTGVSIACVDDAYAFLAADTAALVAFLSRGEVPDSVRQGLVGLFWYALLTPEKRQLWETYPNTILEIGTDSKLAIDLRRPIVADTQQWMKQMGFETTFAVLTACNPPERPASEEENRRWTGELEGNVSALGVPLTQADGVSPDGKHREPGYAVAIPIETAKTLAKQFRQAAFFWFDGAQFWIVPALAQAEPIALPLAN